MRREGPNKYNLLTQIEVVHHFTLPHPERTSVRNCENWCYHLEDQEESPSPPKNPLAPEYYPAPPSDVSSSSSSVGTLDRKNVKSELNTLKREVISLRHANQDQTDR